MATLGEMLARIADETVRPDLATQIRDAVLSAIVYYERERWPWNETRLPLLTVPGQAAYPLALTRLDFVAPVGMDYAYLRPMGDQAFLEWASFALSGDPTDWNFQGGTLSLLPVPVRARAYTVQGMGPLPVLANDDAANAWTTQAEDLIRARAKADLYANVIRDGGTDAQFAKTEEREAYLALRSDAIRRGGANVVRAYPL